MGWTVETDKPYLEEGTFYAVLSEVNKISTTYGNSNQFVFEIIHSEFKGRRVSGLTSMIMSPKSKLYQWCSKLLGRDFEVGEKIGPGDIIGRGTKIIIKASKDGFFNVGDVLALRSSEEKKVEKAVAKYLKWKKENSNEIDDDLDEIDDDLDELDDDEFGEEEIVEEKPKKKAKKAKSKLVEELEDDPFSDDDILDELDDILDELED